MTLEFSQQIFEKSSKTKFSENQSAESRVVPYGQTDTTKRIVAFRNFASAPNKKREVRSEVVTSSPQGNCAGINDEATDSSKKKHEILEN
jgi:hypothetical protein